jgi:4-oxalocrotonate tautomerase
MPLIQVRVIKDVFSKEQKRQIISKLTDAMVSIEGENMRNVTWCVVEEVESGDWGIGGKHRRHPRSGARKGRLTGRPHVAPSCAQGHRRWSWVPLRLGFEPISDLI